MTEEQISILVARIAELPRRIERAVAICTDEQIRARPGDSAWSIAEIFAHLRAADDIIAPRLVQILVRDNPPLPSYDERRWASVVGYAGFDFPASLAVFAARRAELVGILRRLSPADWQRTGLHEAFGPLTLEALTRNLVEHEAEHVAQIERLIS